jgi:glycosyltransferase involved in cell wall biosynthesis
MSEPIALCVPAYNAEGYLPRLLASARRQSVPFDEILVYDDASTDRTAEVATAMGARVIRGRENRGCSFGRNRLAERASAEWIHFHDADDELLPNFVERARHWASRTPGPDVVLFAYEWREDLTGRLLGVHAYDGARARRDPVAYTILAQINPWGLYRRRAFLGAGGADEDPLVLYNEDDAMHGRLARAGLAFDADPTVTMIIYRRADSMSTGRQAECARAKYHVLRKAAESLGGRYATEIAERLWTTAAVSGTVLDWPNVDACVALARSLGSRGPASSSRIFRLACLAMPYRAMRVREAWIRRFRPWLRPGGGPIRTGSELAP